MHTMIFVYVLAVMLVLLICAQDIGIKHYELRTCPLSKILDSKKLCTHEGADLSSSEKRNYKEAYIMIPERKTCYDWKDWRSFGSMSYSCSVMYGLRHAYIMIVEHNRCYEWGTWEYPRTIQCSDDDMECCLQNSRVEYKGTTLCDHRIEEFHKEWKKQGKYYDIFRRNCQTYANSLKKFLEDCPLKPASSIEVCQMQSAALEIFHIRRVNEAAQEIDMRHMDSTQLEKYLETFNMENGETIEICQTNVTTRSNTEERACLVLN